MAEAGVQVRLQLQLLYLPAPAAQGQTRGHRGTYHEADSHRTHCARSTGACVTRRVITECAGRGAPGSDIKLCSIKSIKRQTTVLRRLEALPPPRNSWVRGRQGRHLQARAVDHLACRLSLASWQAVLGSSVLQGRQALHSPVRIRHSPEVGVVDVAVDTEEPLEDIAHLRAGVREP